jgi:hypothetical protein
MRSGQRLRIGSRDTVTVYLIYVHREDGSHLTDVTLDGREAERWRRQHNELVQAQECEVVHHEVPLLPGARVPASRV